MRSTSRRLLLLVALAPALLGTDCDPDRARVAFTLFTGEQGGIDPDRVTVRFDDGGSSRTLMGDDFSGPSGRVDSREFETRTSGTLGVDVTLADGSAQIAAGTVALPLRPDWIWSVDLFLGDRNPTETCFGCVGYRAFPVAAAYRDSPADSLWVVWGGNSISNPVVF